MLLAYLHCSFGFGVCRREVVSLAISSDGRRLLSGGADGNAVMWDAPARQPIKTLHTTKGAVIIIPCFGLFLGSYCSCMYVTSAGSISNVLFLVQPRYSDLRLLPQPLKKYPTPAESEAESATVTLHLSDYLRDVNPAGALPIPLLLFPFLCENGLVFFLFLLLIVCDHGTTRLVCAACSRRVR